MTKFKVGDAVTWCGVEGKVIKDYKFKSDKSASLEVEFPEIRIQSFAEVRAFSETFDYEGKLHFWHKEPSLKHLTNS